MKFGSKPYLTRAERANFQKLRRAGVVSFFRVAKCKNEDCDAEVPKVKDYCSWDCWDKVEGDDDGQETSSQGQMD